MASVPWGSQFCRFQELIVRYIQVIVNLFKFSVCWPGCSNSGLSQDVLWELQPLPLQPVRSLAAGHLGPLFAQICSSGCLPRCSSQFTEYVSSWSDQSTRGITGLRVLTGQLTELLVEDTLNVPLTNRIIPPLHPCMYTTTTTQMIKLRA
jgi:hypothetical protein